jgi:hypothetical protein
MSILDTAYLSVIDAPIAKKPKLSGQTGLSIHPNSDNLYYSLINFEHRRDVLPLRKSI